MPFDGRNCEQQDAVLDVLREARERIARPGGWCQDAYECGAAACAIGALYPTGGTLTGAQREAASLLTMCLPEPFLTVPSYNDAPGRTQAEIVALFDAAIARRTGDISARLPV